VIRARIEAARQRQRERFAKSDSAVANADLAGSDDIQSAHLAEALHAAQSPEVDGNINARPSPSRFIIG
jgi:hypothetical protein